MAESSDSYRICAYLLSCAFSCNRDRIVRDERALGEEVHAWGFACGILLPGALFYCAL